MYKGIIRQVVSFLLCATMLLGLLPVVSFAAQAEAENTVPAAEATPKPSQTETQSNLEEEAQKQQAAVSDPDVSDFVPPLMALMTSNTQYREVLQDSAGYPESDHNYGNNLNKTYTYQVEGAAYLNVTFSSETFVEQNYDYLYIYDGDDALQGKYTAGTLAGQTLQVFGDTIKIKLTSDTSVQKYGFSITSIYAGFLVEYTDFQLTTLPSKLYYAVGETVSLSGLVAMVTDSAGDQQTLTPDDGVTLVSADTSTVGKKTVTVSCGGLSAEFEIYVHQITTGQFEMDPAGYPESSHNYSNNTNKTWTYTAPGASALQLTFNSRTETESNYDFIYLYDGTGTELGKYTGTALASQTITVTGDTFTIKLTSDDSEKEYGFKLDKIIATNMAVHPYDSGVYTPHTCTVDAYTTYTCTICNQEKKEIHAGTATHSWDEGVYTAPTCTADGYTKFTCTVCNTTKTETETGSALGHTMDEGVYTNPDCFADGFTTYTCSVCSHTTTQTDTGSAFHTFEDGSCTACGVSDTVVSGGWFADKNTYWAMLPGNVLYIGGSGTVNYSSSARAGMAAATSVVISEGITALGDSCLRDLTKLTSIEIPDNVTSIGRSAFYGCTGLRYIYIPASVTRIPASYASESPFYNCSSVKIFCETTSRPSGWGASWNYYATYQSLTPNYGMTRQEYQFWSTLDTSATVVVIPDYVTKLPQNAFTGRTSLRYVYIPSGVKSIGNNSFLNCSSKLNIMCESATSGNWSSGWNQYASSSYVPSSFGISKEEFDFWSSLDTSATSVVIPDYVTTIPSYAFDSLTNLKSVTISDSVTTIKSCAFYSKSGLTSVTMGSGVTSIGTKAFYYCTGLTSLYIPASVSQITASNYDSSPFYYCNSNLTLFCGASSKPSGWNTYWNYHSYNSPLRVIYNTTASEFDVWESLNTSGETITVPDGITTIPSGIFQNNTTVKKIILPSSVTTISSNAFSGCSALEQINIPDGVTTIGSSAFKGCTSLAEITIPESVTSMGSSAFYGCTSLTEITIPGSVSTIASSAFYGCTGLAKVTIEEGVTKVDSSAFNSCTALAEISIPASLTQFANYVFSGCTALEKVHIAELAALCGASFYQNTSNPLCYGDLYLKGEKVTDVVIPNGVTEIEDYALYYPGMTSITVPASVQTVGYGAFGNGTALEKVHVQDLSAWCAIDFAGSSANPLYYADLYLNGAAVTDLVIPEDVTEIGEYAFCYPELTSVTFHPGVKTINMNAFYGCNNLTRVNIQDLSSWCAINFGNASANPLYYAQELCLNGAKITSVSVPQANTYLGSYTFVNYDALESVVIPANVTEIGNGAFNGCDNLASVTLTSGLETIGDYAFNGCKLLTQIALPDTLTAIGQSAFYNCTGLTAIHVPALVKSIPSSAFKNCTSLEDLVLPDNLTRIYSEAFYGCNLLTVLSIPGQVTSVAEKAFYNCSGVKEIYFSGNAPTIGSNVFYGITANAYYPYGATGWTDSMQTNYGGTLTWSSYSMEGIVAQGTCGDNVTWSLDEEGTLLLSGSGDMYTYSISSSKTTAPWKNYVSSINQVVVNKGITGIGNYAFYGCSNLTAIHFKGDYPANIGNYAFSNIRATADYSAGNSTWNPSSLSGFGGNITWEPIGQSEEYIASSDLNYTYKYWHLDYDGVLTLYNWDTSYSYSGYQPWYNYRYHIKKVVFGGDMSPDIGNNAFYGLPELTDVEVHGYGDTVGDYAFAYCPKLKNVDLGEEVYHIGNRAFYNCTALESIFLAPDHYGWSIGDYAFAYCSSLKEASIPGSVSLGESVFTSCPKLQAIYINENHNGYNFAPETNSFSGVTATVYYPRGSWGQYSKPSGNYGGSLTWQESDFGTCGVNAKWTYNPTTKALTIYGSGRICGSYFAGGDHPWGAFNDEILSIRVQEGISDIPSYTFEYCESATSIILPTTLTRIDLNAFNDCGSLNNLVLPNSIEFGSNTYNTSFIRCESLRDVYYFGTKAEWDLIPGSGSVNSSNSSMTLHFLELISTPATCTETGLADHYRYDKTEVYGAYYDLNKNIIAQPEVLPASGHTEETIASKAATCTETGLTEGKKCSVCGEVTVAQTVVGATGHSYSTEWSEDETGHWHECACGDKADFAGHTSGGAATETTAETCTVCDYEINPALGHIHRNHLTKVEANPATCTEPGNNAYWSCDCGKYFSDEDATTEIATDSWIIPTTDHEHSTEWSKDETGHWHECTCGDKADFATHSSIGAATETTAETCTVCGYEINPALGHVHSLHLTKTGALGATCTEPGNNEYWTCSCGKFFSDENAANEIAADSWIIAASGHSHSTEWSEDEAGHWHECTCGDKADFAGHTPGAEATETAAQTCTICGYEINPALGHVHSNHLIKTDAEPATCTEPGNNAYWSCDCGKYFSDEDATTEIAKDSWIIPVKDHDHSDEWSKDASGHWHECACGDKVDFAGHTPGAEATETTAQTCTICGYVLNPALGHVHSNHLTKVSANPATCTEPGNSAYWSCDCGKYFSDENAANEIAEDSWVIPATGHNHSTEWSKDASGHWHECACGDKADFARHTSGGAATETTAEICAVCSYEIAPALGHIHSNHLTKVEAEPATCTEAGNSAYWSCDCGKYFSDENVANEIAEDSWVIPAGGHDWANVWTFDDIGHWHVCQNEDCTVTNPTDMDGYGKHVYTSGTDSTCDLCGNVRVSIQLVELPVSATATYLTGLTLSDITLFGGVVIDAEGDLISGTWSWGKSSRVLYAGTANYEAVFTPSNTEISSIRTEVEVTILTADQVLTSQHASPENICTFYAGPGLEMKDMTSSNLDVQPIFVITEDDGEAYVEGTVLYSPEAGFVTVQAQYPGVDVNDDGINEYNAGSVEIHTKFTTVPMYRMYDPNSGEHFYTGSMDEVNNLIAAGWNYEQVAFNFPALGAPVYRLYDGNNSGDHLYTMDQAEIDRLVAQGWTMEGVAFNSAADTEVAQYRLYNPNAHMNGTRGAWHFTSDAGERSMLLEAGWQDQGIGWYSTQK